MGLLINRFNTVTLLYMSPARIWNSNVTIYVVVFLCLMI